MKEKIKNYVDNLFSGIYETKQLLELKEEVSANLLEKINDYIKNGQSEDEAFKKAVSSLGDMSELVESLKKASEAKMTEKFFEDPPPLDKKHVFGYVVASAILLFGIMTTGIVYLKTKNLFPTTATLMPFLIVSSVIFTYFGLTQETRHDYGMNWKRALAYSLSAGVMLFGIFASAVVYFKGIGLYKVIAAAMPFVIPSALVFIYLGLTEKSRRKMNCHWQKQWIEYYTNPEKMEEMMWRGNISGALWIFSIAAFFLVGFTLGWKFSLIVFVIAVGCQVLLEAYFARTRKNS